MRRNLFKFLQSFIKVVVGAGLVAMTLHAGLLLLGIDEAVSEWFFGYSLGGFIMLLITSFVLHLCWKFRACLLFSFAVDQCIILQREFGVFNNFLEEALVSTVVLGSILIIIFCYELIKSETCWDIID